MHVLRLTSHALHLTCKLTSSFAFLLLNRLHSPPDPNLAMSSYPIRPHLHTQKTTLRNASPGLLARVTAGAAHSRWSSAGAPAAGGSGSKRKGFCVARQMSLTLLGLGLLAVRPTKGWVKRLDRSGGKPKPELPNRSFYHTRILDCRRV